jgi:Tfp pilus assembly protein PilN
MKGIDLLPQETAKPRRSRLSWITGLIVVSLFVFALSFLYTAKTTELNRAMEVLSTLESDFAGYAWIDEELVRTGKRKKDIDSKIESATVELEDHLPTDEILRKLPDLMPEGVRLVQFSLADDGRILFSGEATALSRVAGLVVSLEQFDLIDDVKLLKATRVRESDKTFEFETTGKLSPTGGD